MDTHEHTRVKEADAHRHPILQDSHTYSVTRVVFDWDYTTQSTFVKLNLQRDDVSRVLRFIDVQMIRPIHERIEEPYILDNSHRGYDMQIEVGDYDSGDVYFHARSVEEVT